MFYFLFWNKEEFGFLNGFTFFFLLFFDLKLTIYNLFSAHIVWVSNSPPKTKFIYFARILSMYNTNALYSLPSPHHAKYRDCKISASLTISIAALCRSSSYCATNIFFSPFVPARPATPLSYAKSKLKIS